MPKIAYQDFNFKPATLKMIGVVNRIIASRQAEGYDMTLRQIYYSLVKENIIANHEKEYDKLGTVVNNGRLAGLIDWSAVVDRTRDVEILPHWTSPSDMVDAAARQFRIDHWAGQKYRVEAWIEKDSLKGVLARVCQANDVPYFSCRGYTSQSEMWAGAQRLLQYERAGQTPLILHLGDHDPSGKDMTRDIEDRLKMFMGGLRVERLALNFDQIEELQPPENPAKLSDSRAHAYVQEFGYSSWELEALEPSYISKLVQDAIDDVRDPDLWDDAVAETDAGRLHLEKAARHWDDLSENFLADKD